MCAAVWRISIHALLAESDDYRYQLIQADLLFLSTLSLRRATHSFADTLATLQFLSTLSLRRATVSVPKCWGKIFISIHALLAESDLLTVFIVTGFIEFLSTLSLRRATTLYGILFSRGLFLSTLSLRRATLWPRNHSGRDPISIHALLAESD